MATAAELTAAAEHMRKVAAERSRDGYHLSSRAILDVVEMMLSEATTARHAERKAAPVFCHCHPVRRQCVCP